MHVRKNIFPAVFLILTMVDAVPVFLPAQANKETDAGTIGLVVEIDSHRIVDATENASRFYGYGREELESMEMEDLDLASSPLGFDEGEETPQVLLQRTRSGKSKLTLLHTDRLSGTDLLQVTVEDLTGRLTERARYEQMAMAFMFVTALVLAGLFCFTILQVRNFSIRSKARMDKKELETLLHTFLDADDRIGFVKDSKLRFCHANEAAAAYFGLQPQELVGRTEAEIAGSASAGEEERADRTALDQDCLVRRETERDGSSWRITKFPVSLPDGNRGTCTWITDLAEPEDRTRYEEELGRRMSMLVQLFTASFESLQDRYDNVLRQAISFTESQYGILLVKDREPGTYRTISLQESGPSACSFSPGKNTHEPLRSPLWKQALELQKPVIYDTAEQLRPIRDAMPHGHLALSSYLAYPVISDGQVVALLGLANKRGGYTTEDSNLVTLLMSGFWNAKKRIEQKRELEAGKHHLRSLLDSTAEGIFGIDPDGNCTFCNASCLRTLGYGKEEDLLGTPILSLIAGENPERFLSPLSTGTGVSFEHELLQKADGSRFDAFCYAYPQKDGDAVVGEVITFSDITDSTRNLEAVRYLSTHDQLTGVHNRLFFEQQIETLEQRQETPVSVVIGDVNGLKLSNDIFGHAEGDVLLKMVSSTMQDHCPNGCTLSRTGGDEFILLLPGFGPGQAERFTQAVKEELEQFRQPMGSDHISFGTATKERSDQPLSLVLKTAENQMYMQKTLRHAEIQRKQLHQLRSMLYRKLPSEKVRSRNISRMCRKIGIMLGFGKEETNRLYRAGLLHDIGKVVLDPETDCSCLDELSRQEIYQHTVVGFRILKNFDETTDLADSILYHHERWDGNGFPKGLSGNRIPLESRILRFCESYELLTETFGDDRTSIAKALENLSGTVLDPDLVERWLACTQDGPTGSPG
jgi:diguanylate cyclase (GGDEF)-like protein/PAS domain S-box-containing protein/putative nucleotidyltransferase with HDIG domain